MKIIKYISLLFLTALIELGMLATTQAVEITYATIDPDDGIDPSYYVPVSIKQLPFAGGLWDVKIKWNTSFNAAYQRDGSGYPLTPKFIGTDYYDYAARASAWAATNAIKAALVADGYNGVPGFTTSYLITPYWWGYGAGIWTDGLEVGGVVFAAGDSVYRKSGFSIWTSSTANWHVFSSAGTIVKSADSSMTLKFTLGQPTPISEPLSPTPLDGSELRPGFWNTKPDSYFSEFDNNRDTDVDGSDLAVFCTALESDPELSVKIESLASSFGVNSYD